jgi:hypothetical protein
MTLGAGALHAAVIYKWKDADGVVHYSDQAVPGAEKIQTSGGTSTYSGAASVRGLAGAGQTARKTTAPPTPISQLTVSSPAPEQSFFGDEPIPVSLQISPPLSDSQSVTWMLNGAALSDQPPTATHLTLQSLPRGTYSISATVTDVSTGGAQTSNSVTFYVRQPSELSPQHHSH